MEQFPVGGSRQAVYDALRDRGFVMDGWSDKHWTRADGLHAHVYGAGSMLLVARDDLSFHAPMAEALAKIDALATTTPDVLPTTD